MTNEITITAEQVEKMLKRHAKRMERYEKAIERGDRDAENKCSIMLTEMEIMLDILGIEY